jgi:hypothetical protein
LLLANIAMSAMTSSTAASERRRAPTPPWGDGSLFMKGHILIRHVVTISDVTRPPCGLIQPAEFVLGRGSVVLGSMDASGPVGRMGADEVVRLITTRERQHREQEAGTP